MLNTTLVYVEQDKALFLGDSAGADFFTGFKRADLCGKLADTIREIDPDICVEGHWIPEATEDTLVDLMRDV